MANQKIHIAALAILLNTAPACGGSGDDGEDNPIPDPADLSGSFTYEGTSYECEVTSQVFVTDEYSVLCQNDDVGLVQITFKDEASARVAQTFTITKRNFSSHPDATTIDVSYLELGVGYNTDSKDDFPGTAVVAASSDHHVLTLTDVTLESNDELQTMVISAVISF